LCKFLRSLLGAVVLSIASGSSVFAAAKVPPVYAAQPYDWSGFYVGGNIGGHGSEDTDPAFLAANTNYSLTLPALLNQLAPATYDPSGLAAGFHVGYNWQMTNLVYGIEGDFDWLNGTANRNSLTPVPLNPGQFFQFTDSASDRWMSTLRARLGWDADHFLLYVTGGVALSDWQLDHTFINQPQPSAGLLGTANSSVLRIGETVGGGVEFALNPNWIIRAEYLYASFGTAHNYLNAVSPTFAFDYVIFDHPQRLSENLARFGISYKFGSR
jgi:outer membrane immunogenic protein